MNYLDILKLIPGVESPQKRLTFKEKLKWTGIILILYYAMSQIIVWGVDQEAVARFEFLEIVLGSAMGSLITLGIGPIVTASIILQLLNGSGILKWDTNTEEGRMIFMGTQKILAMLFCFFEAIAFVIFGAIPPNLALGPYVVPLLILQLAAGGILIILMDEVVSKWGFGSGVSLFIAAGISKRIIIGSISFLGEGGPAGAIPSALLSFISGRPLDAFISLLPLIFTIVVFFFVVYAQSLRVEIPLAFGQVRGFGRRWPLRFFYTSNIPVILVGALLANMQLWARMMYERGIPLLGTFDASGNPVSGLIYWITPPRQANLSNLVISVVSGNGIPPVAFSWITYALFMIIGSVIFSIFWVETAGMSAKNVARQIQNIGLSVPGFRRDVRIIERVLKRYINALAVLGGATVGLLAAFADFTGALGTGTGILLTVMIIYNLYEELARQHLEDMHPALRRFMGR